MKYDPEYNSYKFNSIDMNFILKALSFYRQHCTFLEQKEKDFIDSFHKGLKNSSPPESKSCECVSYNTSCDS
jgi:hypothetical protein